MDSINAIRLVHQTKWRSDMVRDHAVQYFNLDHDRQRSMWQQNNNRASQLQTWNALQTCDPLGSAKELTTICEL